jgi:hypothetical protein
VVGYSTVSTGFIDTSSANPLLSSSSLFRFRRITSTATIATHNNNRQQATPPMMANNKVSASLVGDVVGLSRCAMFVLLSVVNIVVVVASRELIDVAFVVVVVAATAGVVVASIGVLTVVELESIVAEPLLDDVCSSIGTDIGGPLEDVFAVVFAVVVFVAVVLAVDDDVVVVVIVVVVVVVDGVETGRGVYINNK